ncbi:histidine phosphatase family protein [Nocardioides currus]|uniref:histidine phosphatase family protein n=1 Tax=Nocardioides currus TaxID=2133958 RepID=UPI001403B069|nr:histidine phosphatase family protein [Nocardioides currus]
MRAPVYLVRHGQSEWNVLRLTQGQTDHPRLTDLGRAQAEAAASVLAADLADGEARLVTSDLLRALETARTIGDRLGVEPVLDFRLREQHLGSLEGLRYEESWAHAELHDWTDPELPMAGGESVAAVRRRLAEVLDAVDPAVPTVLVSHGDAIRAAIALLLDQPVTDVPWVEVANGSVARWDGELAWLDPVGDDGPDFAVDEHGTLPGTRPTPR